MRGRLLLAILLPLSSVSCQFDIAVSTEPILGKADLDEIGLAGKWMPAKKQYDPFPHDGDSLITVVGPDEAGTYCVSNNNDPKNKLNFTIERLPNTEHYCLADVVLSDKSSGQKLHLPVYCWAKDKRLVVWLVSSTKVQQQLAERTTDFAVENRGWIEIIKSDPQILHDFLMKHGQLVTGNPNVFEFEAQ